MNSTQHVVILYSRESVEEADTHTTHTQHDRKVQQFIKLFVHNIMKVEKCKIEWQESKLKRNDDEDKIYFSHNRLHN